MLTIFKRHTKECIDRHGRQDPGRKYRRCQCSIHAEGHLGGVMYRRALNTTSWTRAQDMVREKESRGHWDDPGEKKQVTVTEAVHTFMRALAATSNGKAKSTTRKFRSTFLGINPEWALRTKREVSEGLLDFCRTKGLTTLAELTVPVLTDWVASWSCGPHHRSTRVQLLRRFFRYCVEAEWIEKNPAMALEHPRGKAIQSKPTLPFTADEMKRILAECAGRPKLLALALLMRHAGFRISDAATFHKDRMRADGSIFLYAHKTGEPVNIPMHPELQAALDAIAPNERGYYFWSGASAVTTATDNWRRRFEQMFKATGVDHGHPRRCPLCG
jgi:integrase